MKFKEYQQATIRTLPNLQQIYHIGAAPNHQAVGTMNYLTKDKQGLNVFTTLPEVLNLAHMRIGMVSELEELITAITNKDIINVGEELADQLWYISNDLNITAAMGFISEGAYNKLHNYEFTKEMQATNGGTDSKVNTWFNCLVFNSSKLADLFKKYLAYGKPMDSQEYLKTVEYYLAGINNLAATLGINLEHCMETNIAKLRKRFPDKFEADQAINRDTNAERQILEVPPVS